MTITIVDTIGLYTTTRKILAMVEMVVMMAFIFIFICICQTELHHGKVNI